MAMKTCSCGITFNDHGGIYNSCLDCRTFVSSVMMEAAPSLPGLQLNTPSISTAGAHPQYALPASQPKIVYETVSAAPLPTNDNPPKKWNWFNIVVGVVIVVLLIQFSRPYLNLNGTPIPNVVPVVSTETLVIATDIPTVAPSPTPAPPPEVVAVWNQGKVTQCGPKKTSEADRVSAYSATFINLVCKDGSCGRYDYNKDQQPQAGEKLYVVPNFIDMRGDTLVFADDHPAFNGREYALVCFDPDLMKQFGDPQMGDKSRREIVWDLIGGKPNDATMEAKGYWLIPNPLFPHPVAPTPFQPLSSTATATPLPPTPTMSPYDIGYKDLDKWCDPAHTPQIRDQSMCEQYTFPAWQKLGDGNWTADNLNRLKEEYLQSLIPTPTRVRPTPTRSSWVKPTPTYDVGPAATAIVKFFPSPTPTAIVPTPTPPPQTINMLNFPSIIYKDAHSSTSGVYGARCSFVKGGSTVATCSVTNGDGTIYYVDFWVQNCIYPTTFSYTTSNIGSACATLPDGWYITP